MKKDVGPPTRSGVWIPYLGICFLILAIYGNTLHLDYALDDYLVITGNSFTKQGISGIPEILTNDAFTGFFGKQRALVAGGRYRPLSQIMFAVEYQLFGANPFIGHLINLLCYMLLGMMIFKILRKLVGSGNSAWYISIPFLAAILFVAHPIHTEAVANVKGRDEILSMLFSLIAWWFALRYFDTRKASMLIWSGMTLFLALMAKENAITFLAVIPLSLYFYRKARKAGSYILTIIPLLIGSVIYLGLRYNALGFFLGGSVESELLNNPYILASGQEKLATNIYTWGRYFKLLLWPHPLTHDYYPFHIAYKSFGDGQVILSLLAIMLLLGIAVWLFRSKHHISFAILFIVATFSISANVVFNIGTFMNERFLFVPSLGFALILAWLILRLFAKKKQAIAPYILIAPIMLLYGGKTISRNPAWDGDYTLFTTDVKVSSNSIKCLVSAGGKTMERYESLPEDQRDMRSIDQAIGWIKKGVNLHPRYFAGWEQLGKAYYLKEDFESSWQCYDQCLKLNPKSQASFDNQILIAKAASFRNQHELALRLWGSLFDRKPENTAVSSQYADALAQNGQASMALEVINQGLHVAPNDYILLGKKGEIWGRYLNKLDSSEVYLRRAITIEPKYTSGLENLGVVCGMTGRAQESLEWLLKALETDPDNPRILTNIANSYLHTGNKAEADAYLARAAAAGQPK